MLKNGCYAFVLIINGCYVSTAIDHIITNSFLKNDIKTGIIKTDTSDHFPIFIVSSKPDIDVYSTDNFIFKRYINDETMNNFKNKLNEINWENIKTIECPESAYNLFLQQFSAAYENAFPKVKIKIKIKNLLSPWISKGILKSSKKKQKLYDKYLKNRTYKNEKNYKTYKNMFETVKFKSKKNYYNNLITKYKNNIKKTWSIMKEAIGKIKQVNNNLPRRLIINNKEIYAKKTIAESFNNYFINVQSWTLIFAQMRNVAKKCFSANVPKVFIFGLPVRTGTINDFSCKDWVLGSYWHSYMFQANDHMT